jgi:hypothetical protein
MDKFNYRHIHPKILARFTPEELENPDLVYKHYEFCKEENKRTIELMKERIEEEYINTDQTEEDYEEQIKIIESLDTSPHLTFYDIYQEKEILDAELKLKKDRIKIKEQQKVQRYERKQMKKERRQRKTNKMNQ